MHIVGALRIKIGSWGLLITIIGVSALTHGHARARFLVRGEQHIGRRSTARLASPQGLGLGGVAAMKPNANYSPASSLFHSSSATHPIPCDRTAPLYGICVTFPAKKDVLGLLIPRHTVVLHVVVPPDLLCPGE